MTDETSSSFWKARMGFSCQPRSSQEILLQMKAVRPPRMAPSKRDFHIKPPEWRAGGPLRDAGLCSETKRFANYCGAAFGCCAMLKILPSGSLNQATLSPEGAVQIPSSRS